MLRLRTSHRASRLFSIMKMLSRVPSNKNLADHKRFVYSPGRSVSLRPLRRRTERSRRSRGVVQLALDWRGAPAGQHHGSLGHFPL